MKNVLIICDAFPPNFAPRMGYLCKYLPENGWQADVVSELLHADKHFKSLETSANVHFVDFYKKENVCEWLFFAIKRILFDSKNKAIEHEAEKLIAKKRYDTILTSSYCIFPLPAALRIAKRHKIPLVVDLRDIVEQYTGDEFLLHKIPNIFGLRKPLTSLLKKRWIQQRNAILRQADCVTTVSEWHADLLGKINPKTKLIRNGFDPELFYPKHENAKKFFITYTGRILGEKFQNPTLLFQAIERLSKENKISKDDLSVRWFVDEKSKEIVHKFIDKYPISQYFTKIEKIVPFCEIPRILNESGIVLVLTNKAGQGGPKGVLGTKLYEALAVEIPILCIQSDEGEMAETLQKTNAGLAAKNLDETCDFIGKLYNDWKSGTENHFEPNKEEIDKFSRRKQARQFVEIFNEISGNEN